MLEDPEGAKRFSKEDKSLCRTLVAALPLLFVVPTECCQNLKHITDKRAKPILDKVHLLPVQQEFPRVSCDMPLMYAGYCDPTVGPGLQGSEVGLL